LSQTYTRTLVKSSLNPKLVTVLKTQTLLLILLLAAASTTVVPTKAQGQTIVVPDDYSTLEDDIIYFRDGNYSALK
jgi:hypothetical protein